MGEGRVGRRELLGLMAAATTATLLPVPFARPGRAAPAVPLEPGRTTLDATIQRSPGTGYRRLVWGPGEPFLVREDLGARAAAGREQTRRSLLYFAQMSDTHINDSQSPGRFELGEDFWMLGAESATWPHEALTVHVLDQLVRAVNAVPNSPVTGAPLAFSVVTGDNTDNAHLDEVRWFIDTLDGLVVTPDSGAPGRYEGVQRMRGLHWAYHPDDPSRDDYGQHGFPLLAGLLDEALQPVATAGLERPWYSVFGNHDALWQGNLATSTWALQMLARSRVKPVDVGAMAGALIGGAIAESLGMQQPFEALWNSSADGVARRAVTPDASRVLLDSRAFMAEHFRTESFPGPVGHGFAPENLASGDTWWAKDVGPGARLIGLDTCNHVAGADGSLCDKQFRWLEAELQASSSSYFDRAGNRVASSGTDRLVVVASHHCSWTLENYIDDPRYPGPRHGGQELLGTLLRYPNVVAWVNGHTHANNIRAHRSPHEPGTGLWEVNTASCVDFGQQGRLVDIVDNQDGTLSIFTVTIDHVAPPSGDGVLDRTARLASVGRELSANDVYWRAKPAARRGSIEDRNCELIVRSPFAR